MPEFYDYDWHCLDHDHTWSRELDEHTTPRYCPKAEAWAEKERPPRCDVTTVGEARKGDRINDRDAAREDRRLRL